jgi:dTDP-4-amino-4,6-dideoxygalactose transaminase
MSNTELNIKAIMDKVAANKTSENIPVFKPLIEEEELAAMVEALAEGWLGMGSYVGDFEEALKKYLQLDDNKYILCVNTGHSANHLAMEISGIGPGDEVIVPSFNNVSDFMAILHTGATPVMCDIDDDTLCIDLDKAEKLINENTKMIIVIDYALMLADHDKAKALGEKYNLRILHDAAHSLGFRKDDKMVGNFSDFTMLSFDPIKNITSMDGGALIVNSKEEYELLKGKRYLGMVQSKGDAIYGNKKMWNYDVSMNGYRYHMANSHAAVGIENLKKINVIKSTRIAVCKIYDDLLGELNGDHIRLCDVPNYDDTVPFIYYIRVLNGKREELKSFMKAKNIDTGVHWQPGHTFSYFKDVKRSDMTITEQVGKEIMSIPLYSKIAESDVIRSAEAILEFFKK